MAVRYHASETAFKILFGAGVKPDSYDKIGMTPLLESIKQNRFKIAELLLKNGAKSNFFVVSEGLKLYGNRCSINVPTYPLLYSIKLRKPRFVKLLIDSKANVNSIKDRCGNTPPLHFAVQVAKSKSSLQIIELLLKAKANMYYRMNSFEELPLERMIYTPRKLRNDIYQLFVKYGYEGVVEDRFWRIRYFFQPWL